MKHPHRLIVSTIATLSLHLTALAAPLIPCELPSFTMQISKFSFNNATDFLELTVIDDGNSGKGIHLTNWKVTTIDTTLTTLNQQVTTGQKIHLPEIGNLTATTDQLALIDDQGQIHDAVCWVNSKPTTQEQQDFTKLATSWTGDLSTCLSSTTLEKNTIFERASTVDTDSRADWKISEPQTQAQAQIQTPQPTAPVLTPTSHDPIATNELTLSELLPDPEGNDENNEWIELHNTSDHTVRLTGWQLDDAEGGSKPFTFTTQTIGPESFLLLKNSTTNITLNNSQDSVRLLNPEKKIISEFTYEKTESNQSWAITKSNIWKLTTRSTPEEENIFTEEVSEKSEKDEEPTKPKIPTELTEPATVEISELLPNPAGADTGKEWIEIHNKTSEPISLANWKIQNKEGKVFTLPTSASIPGNGYLILTDETTKIRMKNSDDEIQLIDAEHMIQDQVEFEEAPENTSFAEIETIPVIHTKPTENSATTFLQKFIGVAHAQTHADIPEETSWEWTRNITQGKPNPKHYTIEGNITQSLNDAQIFTITAQNKEFSIRIPEEMLTPGLAKNIFQAGELMKVTAQKNGESYILESYATDEKSMAMAKPKEKESSPLILILVLIAATGGAVYYKFIRRDYRASSKLDDILLHKSPPEPQLR